MLKDTQVEIM